MTNSDKMPSTHDVTLNSKAMTQFNSALISLNCHSHSQMKEKHEKNIKGVEN